MVGLVVCLVEAMVVVGLVVGLLLTRPCLLREPTVPLADHVDMSLQAFTARQLAVQRGKVQGLNRKTLHMSLPGSLLPLRPQSNICTRFSFTPLVIVLLNSTCIVDTRNSLAFK